MLLTGSARDAPATCRRACFRACSRIVLSTASRILSRASMANDARARALTLSPARTPSAFSRGSRSQGTLVARELVVVSDPTQRELNRTIV